MSELKVGDRVIFYNDFRNYGVGDHNPLWGVYKDKVVGIITDISDRPSGIRVCDVDWDNGKHNSYHVDTIKKWAGSRLARRYKDGANVGL